MTGYLQTDVEQFYEFLMGGVLHVRHPGYNVYGGGLGRIAAT